MTRNKQLKYKGKSLDQTKDDKLAVDLDTRFLTKQVRFSFRDCQIDNKFGLKVLAKANRDVISDFLQRVMCKKVWDFRAV